MSEMLKKFRNTRKVITDIRDIVKIDAFESGESDCLHCECQAVFDKIVERLIEWNPTWKERYFS